MENELIDYEPKKKSNYLVNALWVFNIVMGLLATYGMFCIIRHLTESDWYIRHSIF